MAVLDGIKSYSHEAFTFYLKEKKNDENTAEKFDRLRKIRNGINYYGKEISTEEVKEHKKTIIEMIKHLKEMHLMEKNLEEK